MGRNFMGNNSVELKEILANIWNCPAVLRYFVAGEQSQTYVGELLDGIFFYCVLG